ncbi:hypothetical protein N0Y54_18420 [Nostoc punctiforme UO1]|uniref:hypothetical protein n=1 Tax=Nostoc punctiforme TaxID=272131 RepID=UPI0030AF1F52
MHSKTLVQRSLLSPMQSGSLNAKIRFTSSFVRKVTVEGKLKARLGVETVAVIRQSLYLA